MSLILATWEAAGPVALKAAKEKMNQGGALLDILESGLAACEEDETLLSIGRGAFPNADGDLELDASMMEGTTMEAGAVCGVRGICPVISVARRVMDKTPHVMLCGDNARRFALEEGFPARCLMTEESVRRYEEWRAKGSPMMTKGDYIHSSVEEHPDTVTMLGLMEGRVAAGCATSGLSWKKPGRVGDSPIVGAGIYADDQAGAAGATGWGEMLWRAGASLRAVENMRQGMSAQEACEAVIRFMGARLPNPFALPCVVLAVGADGSYGAACGGGEFHLWIMKDGEVWVEKKEPILP